MIMFSQDTELPQFWGCHHGPDNDYAVARDRRTLGYAGVVTNPLAV